MKKSIGIIIAAIGAVLYLTCAATIAVAFFYDMQALLRASVFGLFLAVVIALGITGLFIVNLGMKMFDGEYTMAGRNGLGRWAENIMFAGLVVIFMVGIVWVDQGFITEGMRLTQAILSGLVLLAAIFYARIYYINKKKRDQIKKLIRENSMNGDRRFAMLVENTIPDRKNSATAVCGVVHGSLHLHDHVEVLVPGLKPRMFEVIRLRTNSKDVNKVTDQAAGVYLNLYMEKDEIPKYSTITNIKSNVQKKGINDTECPSLLAEIGEYRTFFKDRSFMAVLIYTACHAKYLVPVQTSEAQKEMDDPTKQLAHDTTISFTQVATRKNNSQKLLPIYTDWFALYHWRYISEAGNRTAAVIMDFPDIMKVAENGYHGVIVNPFGPQPFFMSSEFMKSVKKLPGYQQENKD